MSDLGQQGNQATGFGFSPRVAGIVVTAGVVALPGIPVGYLTPLAIFLGLWTVFVMEARKYRREHAGRQDAVNGRLQVSNRQVAEMPMAVHEAPVMATGKADMATGKID